MPLDTLEVSGEAVKYSVVNVGTVDDDYDSSCDCCLRRKVRELEAELSRHRSMIDEAARVIRDGEEVGIVVVANARLGQVISEIRERG